MRMRNEAEYIPDEKRWMDIDWTMVAMF